MRRATVRCCELRTRPQKLSPATPPRQHTPDLEPDLNRLCGAASAPGRAERRCGTMRRCDGQILPARGVGRAYEICTGGRRTTVTNTTVNGSLCQQSVVTYSCTCTCIHVKDHIAGAHHLYTVSPISKRAPRSVDMSVDRARVPSRPGRNQTLLTASGFGITWPCALGTDDPSNGCFSAQVLGCAPLKKEHMQED
jgi:hypothetical protein